MSLYGHERQEVSVKRMLLVDWERAKNLYGN